MKAPRIAFVACVLLLIGGGVAFQLMRVRARKASEVRAAATARDQQLVTALATMRGAISSFRSRNGRAPSTLQELVPLYLPAIPVDPITGSSGTWLLTTEETVTNPEDFTPSSSIGRTIAILEVRSGAKGTDARGRAWSDY